MIQKKIAVALAAVMTLSACTPTHQGAREQHDTVGNQAKDAAQMVPRSDLGLIRSEGYYLGAGTVQAKKPELLQRRVGAPGIHTSVPHTIVEFARIFSEHVGVRIDIAADILQPREGEGSSSDPIKVVDSTGVAAPMGSPAPASDQRELPRLRTSISGNETVEAALTRTVSSHGFGWRYEPNGDYIVIQRYETAVFDLPFPSGTRNAALQLSAGQLTAGMNQSQNPVQSLLEAVKGMLSPEGDVRASESGSLIVNDVPSVVSVIRDFVDTEIKKMKRQVLLQVRLFAFDKSVSENYGLNWNLAYQESPGDNPHDLVNLVSLGGIGVTGAQRLGMSIVSPKSRMAGTTVNLDALSRESGVSVAYDNNFLTLSGSAVTASEIRKTAYLKSVSATEGVTSDRVTTTLEPGEVDTGLSLFLQPMVSGDDIVMNLGFSHISLVNLSSEESGESRITTPETSGRDTSQTVRLPNGGAVALTGFYVSSADSNDQGVGSPRFKLLGGSKQSELSNRRAVLVISASIVE